MRSGPIAAVYCCSEAVKKRPELKEADPGKDVTIIYRDVRTFGLKEDYYKKGERTENGQNSSATTKTGNRRFVRTETRSPSRSLIRS